MSGKITAVKAVGTVIALTLLVQSVLILITYRKNYGHAHHKIEDATFHVTHHCGIAGERDEDVLRKCDQSKDIMMSSATELALNETIAEFNPCANGRCTLPGKDFFVYMGVILVAILLLLLKILDTWHNAQLTPFLQKKKD